MNKRFSNKSCSKNRNRVSKNVKNKKNNWFQKRILRDISILFGVSFCGLIGLHYLLNGVIDTDIQKMLYPKPELIEYSIDNQAINYSAPLKDFVESPIENQELQDSLNTTSLLAEIEEKNSFEKKDISQMTKSKVVAYKDELVSFLNYFEIFGIHEENELYLNLKEEYDACVSALENGTYLYPYSDYDYKLLAEVIMREQGDNRSPDEAQMLVGCVVLNRVANGGIGGRLENPTIMDVLLEPGQYPYNDWDINEGRITDKVWENTRKVLEHEYEAPANVLYQALFKQGEGVYKSFYNEGYGSTTYFCYGWLAE